MEVIVPIHEASEASFFMSKLPSKLRARIMQDSAEKCKKINKGDRSSHLVSQEVKFRSRVKGKLRTLNSSFKGGGRKKDKRQLTPMMLIRMVMNHVPSGAHLSSYLLHAQCVVTLNGQHN